MSLKRQLSLDHESGSVFGAAKAKTKRFTFSVERIDQRTKFPSFSKPEIVGAFSLNPVREYVEGIAGLKYLQLPADLDHVEYDLDELTRRHNLSQKSPEAIAQEELLHTQTNELLHLLEWINRNEGIFLQKKPHFVLYRGLMTKLLGTPYEGREGWKLGALLKNGTIYLRNIDTDESVQNRRRQASDPRQCQMTSWGYNFEKFLLSEIDGVWLPAGSNADLKSDFRLLKDSSLVELKTTREFPQQGMTRNFRRFNLRKWWSQTFTVGISHVIAGLRDDDGVVKSLKVFTVKDLSKEGSEWSPTVCFNFLARFLDQVKSIVQNDESSVYTIEFIPRRNMLTFQVEVCTIEDSPYGLKNLL